MGMSCSIVPQVRNSKGELTDSRLFMDLLSFNSNNRDAAREQYLITKNPEFAERVGDKVKLDEFGEPLLSDLLKHTDLNKFISTRQVVETLNKKIGYFDRKGNTKYHEDTYENYDSLMSTASNFNNHSEYSKDYMARVNRVSVDGSTKLTIKVEPRTRKNTLEFRKAEYNYNLNRKLRAILKQKGISIGALSTLEQRMGINGVSDFDRASKTANGLIELIRIAKGYRGEQALPEEFAHCVLEMLDSPLKERLFSLITNQGLAREILGEEYDRYNELYKGDAEKLATEAAGKLLAKHFLEGQEIPSKPYKSLLTRIIDAIKNMFGKLSSIDIRTAMVEADREAGKLAKSILGGTLTDRMDIKNINRTGQLFQALTESTSKAREALEKIIETEIKRYKIYSGKGEKSKEFTEKQRDLIYDLQDKLQSNSEALGVYMFVEDASNTLSQILTRIEADSYDMLSTREKAILLRNIRNYMFSYSNIIQTIRDAVKENKDELNEDAMSKVNELAATISELYSRYNNLAFPLFAEFLKPFMGEEIVVPFGKDKGKVITVESLLKSADKDITVFDRWLDSMADSSDFLLKGIDSVVKNSKEDARLATIDTNKRLQATLIKLEQAGVKDTSWMYERDAEGNKTGNYISEINQAEFKKRRDQMYKDLQEKYGDDMTDEEYQAYRQEVSQWYRENVEKRNNEWQPKLSIYANEAFSNLNEAQLEYYNTIMEIKKELDEKLPPNRTKPLGIITIRKDLLERLKASGNITAGFRQIWEASKDLLIRRSDDIDSATRTALKDFEGNEVKYLPIFYTSLKEGESYNDVSEDTTSTMLAYAAMANDYAAMNEIIDILEVGRDLLKEREIQETRAGKGLIERMQAFGTTVESKLTKGKGESKFLARLNDFYDMQIYGRYMKDEGTIGKSKVDVGKAANLINRITALNTLAFNLLAGISNMATGVVMMNIESISGEYFTAKDNLIADKIYSANIMQYLAEVGDRVKTSKLALWYEKFNVLQDYEGEIRNAEYDKKNWASRLLNEGALFALQNSGEHWMQGRTSLALANTIKMKSPDGKIVSLWDAMEVVYIDPNNKKLGASLQVKEGYTKEDGTEFTNDDIKRFTRKSAAINQRLHGIYNKLDKNALQKLGIGRMAMMYRKYMRPAYNRRFRGITYNFDLQEWTEGYYHTAGRFIGQLVKELRQGQFNLSTNYKNLDQREKYNIRRALIEVSTFLALGLLLGALDGIPDDEDDWAINMAEYQARRLFTEVGALTPTPLMLNEAGKLLKTPAAGIVTIEGVLDLAGLFIPSNYETFNGEDAILKSGRYKGESKATKLFWESPLFPFHRTIYRGLHPDEMTSYFKK